MVAWTSLLDSIVIMVVLHARLLLLLLSLVIVVVVVVVEGGGRETKVTLEGTRQTSSKYIVAIPERMDPAFAACPVIKKCKNKKYFDYVTCRCRKILFV